MVTQLVVQDSETRWSVVGLLAGLNDCRDGAVRVDVQERVRILGDSLGEHGLGDMDGKRQGPEGNTDE